MNSFQLRSKYPAIFTIILVCQVIMIDAQIEPLIKKANQYIEKSSQNWGLTKDDIKELIVADGYTSKSTGTTYLYMQQAVNGIPISNAITNIIIDRSGKTRTVSHRFIKEANNRIVKSKGSTKNALEAIKIVSKNLGIEIGNNLKSSDDTSSTLLKFQSEKIEKEISASRIYDLDNQGNLKQCWKILLDDPLSADMWQVHMDINSGEIINKFNYTVYCRHGKEKFSHQNYNCNSNLSSNEEIFEDMSNASYLVYKLPTESPIHGVRELASDDMFPQASPWGWHDDNGDGVEYTITRGNNVHAYEDSNDNNSSQNNEPDGGIGLSFIFDHNQNANPESSEEASITNLFYTNNMAHDLFYLLGFTEEAGNFQNRNMGLGGKENDYVRAEGLDGEDLGNANFSTPGDGGNGRMQMYLFNIAPSLLKIESPSQLKDLNFELGLAGFGQNLSAANLVGEIAAFKTNNDRPETIACENIISNLSGRIAMVDRGVCDFSLKVYHAQQAGAIMAIVCNVEGVNGGTGEELLTMSAGDNAGQVTIPSAFMKKSDCDLIRTTIDNGEIVTASVKDRQVSGPSLLDADFDNGVILHEYGHGVSLRLTGGPANSSCLPDFDDDNNGSSDRGEQMGEGWSDFFGLVFTTRIEDSGFEPRGIGTYVENENPDQNGIRSFPYSTDMDINPLTYDDIKTQSVPHGVGTVWASILWDMYWNFIEIYGFNPDWRNTESGNYRACFLVMEALKIQPCRPGFVDGRNAILEADNIYFNGDHQKIIWESFARRGVGMNADQGSAIDQRDGTEDFSIPPLLIEELKIEKTSSRFVEPGENFHVNIKVTNHIPAVQNNVTIIEEIPEGLVYVDGSSVISPILEAGMLIFEIGSLEYLEEVNLTFELNTDQDIISTTLYLDDIENGMNGWSTESRKGAIPWNIVNSESLSGQMSWYIQETNNEEVDQILVSPELSVSGENPVFRFWHQYDIVPGANGGFIELSTDGGDNWIEVDQMFILRNRYPGELAFSTFAIPSLKGFSGSTEGKWIDSYIDLTQYNGKNIMFRFRFGNEGVLVSNGENPGWFVDEIELIDLEVYSSIACVSSSENPENRCSDIQHTVVHSGSTTSVVEQDNKNPGFSIFPNPANQIISIKFDNTVKDGKLFIKSIEGKTIASQLLDNKYESHTIDVSNFNAGLYLITIIEGDKAYTQKVQIIR